MPFEWDENKRRINLDKHGLDFREAWKLFDGRPAVVRHSARQSEERWVTVGLMDERLVALVWIERDGFVRLISLRRARHGEERTYRALHG